MLNQTFQIVTAFILTITFQLFSQPSGEEYRRTAVIDGNSIQTVITNSGIIGQPGSVGPRGTWNGIYNVYFGDMSILLGLELPIRDYINASSDTLDGIPDTIHSVIITPVNRPGGGENGWNFEPKDSFFNPSISDPTKGIALSNYSETWPDIWPDHPEYGSGVWNGLYGPDNYTGTQEAYYQVDDENDEEMFLRHDFLPDSTNSNIKGHGIRVNVRYVQLGNPLFKDILFKIYDIKNESLHNYHKLVFGGLTGTYIGGESPEWNDDVSLYYPLDNIIISYDFDEYIDPSANPNWEGDVGRFGEAFIDAPSNNQIASFQYFVPAGDITMGNDEDMWNRLLPGSYEYPNSVIWQDSIPTAIRGEDGDHMWGSDYFTLDAGETKRIATVLVFGYTNEEVLDKIRLAEALYNTNFDTTLVSVDDETNIPFTYSLSQNFPNPFNPSTTIRYQIPQNGFVTLKVYDILGKEIATLVNEEKSSGRYEVNFNASSLASGVYLYRLNVNDYVVVKKMLLLK